jgi:hypothetical protein
MTSVDPYLSRIYEINSYTCLHFACDVWEDLTGTNVTPVFTEILPPKHGLLTKNTVKKFSRVPQPVDPCFVLMRNKSDTPHMGVYLRRRVLHLTGTGAKYESLDTLRGIYPDIRFYICP